jgi:iron complex transport system substrate-binding protein
VLAVLAASVAGVEPVGAAAAAPPARVVTLAPHLTELVYAAGAGARIVGTVDTSDYPDAARQIPRIGDVTRLDAERLLALRPDLVIAWGDGTPAEQLALLKRLGVPSLAMQQNALADVPDAVEQLGRLFGTERVANAEATRLRDELARLRARYATAAPLRVFYQVWDAPLYTLGGTQVATEMLGVCGARNVFAAQRHSAFAVDAESVYAAAPDVVVLAGSPNETAEWRARWPGGHGFAPRSCRSTRISRTGWARGSSPAQPCSAPGSMRCGPRTRPRSGDEGQPVRPSRELASLDRGGARGGARRHAADRRADEARRAEPPSRRGARDAAGAPRSAGRRRERRRPVGVPGRRVPAERAGERHDQALSTSSRHSPPRCASRVTRP